MITAEQIEQALAPLLPAEQRALAPGVARLLADLASGDRTAAEARAEVAGNPALAQALGALGGRQVASDSTVLSFGEGSQLGDVSVRDVAGGNIINLSLPAQPPRRQQIDERRTYGCLGLPVFSITSSRTIVTLALTIFLSGAMLGGLLTSGLGGQAPPAAATSVVSPTDTPLPTPTPTPESISTALATTVEAAVQQTVSALTTATAAAD